MTRPPARVAPAEEGQQQPQDQGWTKKSLRSAPLVNGKNHYSRGIAR